MTESSACEESAPKETWGRRAKAGVAHSEDRVASGGCEAAAACRGPRAQDSSQQLQDNTSALVRPPLSLAIASWRGAGLGGPRRGGGGGETDMP